MNYRQVLFLIIFIVCESTVLSDTGVTIAKIPPELKITESVIGNKIVFAKDNRAKVTAKIKLINTGTDDAKNAEITFLGPQNQVWYVLKKDLVPAGQTIETDFYLSILEILSVVDKGIGMKIKTDNQSVEQIIKITTGMELLKTIFSPILLLDWKCYRGEIADAEKKEFDDSAWPYMSVNENLPEGKDTLWLRRQLTFSRTFKGLSINIVPGFPKNAVDSFYINGSSVEYSGFGINITTQMVSTNSFMIAVKFKPGIEKFVKYPQLQIIYPEVNDYLDYCEYGNFFVSMSGEEYNKNISELLQLFSENDIEGFGDSLRKNIEKFGSLKEKLKQNKIHLFGNAHIDMPEFRKNEEFADVLVKSFDNILKLMDEYPSFVFCQDQVQIYRWLEDKYPEKFKKVQDKIKNNQWAIYGGMWLEPDCNLLSGESLVRQILYGKQYFKDKFGVNVKVAWLPDITDFCWTLPQIFDKSGINYFVTTRVSEMNTIKFPYNLFWWESVTGARVLSYIAPTYDGNVKQDLITDYKKFQDQTNNFPDFMFIFGKNVNNGGLTKDDIESAITYSKVKLFPEVDFDTSREYFIAVEDRIKEEKYKNLPVWNNEICLNNNETYTTQPENKKYNRLSETLILDTEKLCSLNKFLFGKEYPADSLTKLWRKIMVNQSYDILNGSAAYKDAEKDYKEILRENEKTQSSSLKNIAQQINTSINKGVPIIVFNTLSWVRTGWVETEIPLTKGMNSVKIVDDQNRTIVFQVINKDKEKLRIGFIAEQVPSIGYKTYWITQLKQGRKHAANLKIAANYLENEYFRVVVDPPTGCITSIFDKVNQREVLDNSKKCNMLQIVSNKPDNKNQENIKDSKSVEIVENGPLRVRLRIRKDYQTSEFVQDIVLYNKLPIIEFPVLVKWNENQNILKVIFPVNVNSKTATYEIPYGSIKRSTQRLKPEEKNRLAVPALRWADLSGKDYGVSLLNDCKYGYDIQNNTISLFLMYNPNQPDLNTVENEHSFRYALYPHKNDWRESGTVQQGHEFNNPLLVVTDTSHKGTLPPVHGFIRLNSDPSGQVILSAIKKSENSDTYIFRLYELWGKDAKFEINLPKKPVSIWETDLLENNLSEIQQKEKKIVVNAAPYEIKSIKIKFKSD